MAESPMQNRATEIVLVPLGDIKLNPENRNSHDQEQVDQLIKIIKYQGFREPGVINKATGILESGEGRYLALKQMGATHMPCMIQDFDDGEMSYLYGVSTNAIARQAELDLPAIHVDIGQMGPFDLDLLGIKDFQFEPDPDAQGDPDAVPEVPKEAKTKRGELWLLGEHRLLIDDCTVKENVERLMGGEKADMVFTDPPYGMSVVKKDGNNNGLGEAINGVVGVAARGKYLPVAGDGDTKTAKAAYDICSSLGIETQIFWGAHFYAEAVAPSPGWIVWDKENGEGFFADGELAWTNSNKQLRIYRHQWKGMIRASEMGEKRVHPTQKPIALAEWCFENYGAPKSVLDLFLGSGSTLIACEKTNRRCYGCEIEPLYGQVIIERWIKYTGKMAYREDGKSWEEVSAEG